MNKFVKWWVLQIQYNNFVRRPVALICMVFLVPCLVLKFLFFIPLGIFLYSIVAIKDFVSPLLVDVQHDFCGIFKKLKNLYLIGIGKRNNPQRGER